MELAGTLALVLSSISWALGSLYSSKAQLLVSILASSSMLMLVGGVLLIATSLSLGEFRDLELSQISARSSGALVYLIAVNSMIAFTDFYWLLRVTSPSLANTFAYGSPVIAVIFGWAILKESITYMTIVAMSIILAGVALMVTRTANGRKDDKSKTVTNIQKE